VSAGTSVAAGADEARTIVAPPYRPPVAARPVAGDAAAQIAAAPRCAPQCATRCATPPAAVPGYTLLGELGHGGMGMVYLAEQRALKRPVALKMILAGFDGHHATLRRFRTEAQAVARLQHTNIVQIHEVGEVNGRPFLALEYVEGGTLRRRIADAALPEAEAARLVETLARAVAYMHQREIVHRDLNPNNVLLTPDGTPKISDFGLAKVLDLPSGPTRTEALMGTPCYMAPEQATGNTRHIGPLADVYGLGAILYELLTGRPPFTGDTPLGVLEQVRTAEPIAPRRLRHATSRDLETICLKCLHKDPGERYSSAAALADDLHRYQQREPIAARPIPRWQRVWRSVRRRPAVAASVLAGAALAALLATAGMNVRMAEQLAQHRVQEHHQRFLQCRDEAFLHGLLSADDGTCLLALDRTETLQTAAAAAREAFSLSGVSVDSAAPVTATDLPVERRADSIADCYALLVMLAGIRGQQATAGDHGDPRHDEALDILDRAGKLQLPTRAWHLRRAEILERQGHAGAAAAARDRAAHVPPTGALDFFLIGEEQFRRGNWAQAASAFSAVLGEDAGHFWSQFFLAVCRLRERQWDAARAGLTACLARRPDFVWAYLYRSIAHEQGQSLAAAQADLDKAVELYANDHARYVLYNRRGIFYLGQKDCDRAATEFHAALAVNAEQYHAHLNLAHVCLAQRRHNAAAAQVERALRCQPPPRLVAGYHAERARLLLTDQRYEEAVDACNVALGLWPDQPLAHEVMAQALLALGRYELAESSFGTALRLGGTATADLFRARGSVRMKLGKYPDAAEDYSHALALAADADIYQHRGWALFFADAWRLALRDFARAIELDPTAADAYVGRGLARVMLGDYTEAVADAESALSRAPRTPEMMHNVACIFAQSAVRAAADPLAQNQETRAAEYRDRAVDIVRRTMALAQPEERQAFWHDKVLGDAALVPLRDHPEFHRLHEEYGG
jgi:tetratricopeptide (TPR) repeat protein